MELEKIHDFLHNQISDKWFDVDLSLYVKIFPQSKLLEALSNIPDFKKTELDERMCAEMMLNGAVCDCTILENRGFTRDKDNFIVPLTRNGELDGFEKELLALNLDDKPKYNTLKKLVFGLGLHTPNNNVNTYVTVLKEKKTLLLQIEAKPSTPVLETEISAEVVTNDTERANFEKKSEVHE